MRQLRTLAWTVALLSMMAGCPPEPPPDAATGLVETFAGAGAAGFSGDGAAARSAQLDQPLDVKIDATGRVLIADAGNNRIRAVDPATGTISTIAGGSADDALVTPSGIGLDADGAIYVASWGEHRVYRYPAGGVRELLAGTGAQSCAANRPSGAPPTLTLNLPRSVGVWEGQLLIAEQGCHRVRAVSLADATLRSFVGNGEAGYGGDGGPAEDARLAALLGDAPAPCFGFGLSPEDPPDELYIADTANHVVREVRLFTGEIETFAGTGQAGFADGPPSQAAFSSPGGIYTSADHAVWVADTGNHAIRRIDPLGTRVVTVMGTGTAGFNGDGLPPTETQLDRPAAVFVADDGYVYVADAGNHRIRRFLYLGSD